MVIIKVRNLRTSILDNNTFRIDPMIKTIHNQIKDVAY